MSDDTLEMTDEEIEQMVIRELGYTVLGLIAGATQLRHVTLRGHLHYQHEVRGTVGGDFIGWIRCMTAWGKQERDEIQWPQELMDYAVRVTMKNVSNRMKEFR